MYRPLLIVAGCLFASGTCNCLHAVEVVGKLVEINGDTIRIASDSKRVPQPGDRVEVYFELEGLDDVAKVATGTVTTVEQNRVTARLDAKRGKVQEGMSVRILVSQPSSPDKPAPSATGVREITGTVVKVVGKTVRISPQSTRMPQVGDSVVFCFRIPGTKEVLKSGSGTVAAADRGNIVAKLVEGFVLEGHSVRIPVRVRESPHPEDPADSPNDDRAEVDAITAATAIERLGGKITKLADGRVFIIDLSDTEATDADLANLRPFRDVAFVSLDNTKTTDNGLRYLRHLRQLESLTLASTRITDAGLRHLSGFAHLESLILRDTAITDHGLRFLGGLKKLQLLDVGGTKVTSQGADELGTKLPTLKAVVGIEEAVRPSSADSHEYETSEQDVPSHSAPP